LTTQGVLLERLGITERAKNLAKNLSGKDLKSHIAAHRRLTHPNEMGSLFKALSLFPKQAPCPPGFQK
jgi:SAM-dependent MidA family methyltransferase